MAGEALKTKKAFCAKCKGERNCFIRGAHESNAKTGLAIWKNDWLILECCGCEHVFFQHISTDLSTASESRDQDGASYEEFEQEASYWPPIPRREAPGWLIDIFGFEGSENETLRVPLSELYGAINGGMKILPSIGIRTCFDVAATILGVEESLPFDSKLQELEKQGLLKQEDRERLGTLVDAGSAAAHRGWNPEHQQLGLLIEILEHFLFQQFVDPTQKARLNEKAKELRADVPTRNGRETPIARDDNS